MLIQKHTNKAKLWIILGIALVIIVAGAIIGSSLYSSVNRRPPATNVSKPYDSTTFNSDSNVPAATNDPSSNSVASNKDASGTQTAPTPADGTTPDAPSGAFVSNENVTLSGDRSQINSVCATTPGAQCTIIFTKDGVTRQLPVKTADSTGHAVWNWNTADPSINLSPGTWNISATATIGTKTATTNYPIQLKVSP